MRNDANKCIFKQKKEQLKKMKQFLKIKNVSIKQITDTL